MTEPHKCRVLWCREPSAYPNGSEFCARHADDFGAWFLRQPDTQMKTAEGWERFAAMLNGQPEAPCR